MAILPKSREQMVQFFENHAPVWAADPAAIGLSAAQVADLATKVSTARTSLSNRAAAINAKLAATETMHRETDDLRSFGADLIKVIKAYAESTDDPAVYEQAQVPPPAPPTPTGPPKPPANLSAVINNFGQVILTWTGSRAAGTQFILERRMTAVDGTVGDWTYAGTSVANEYTDNAVPVGFAAASYRVYALRSAGQSDASTTVTLNFGTAGSGSGTSASGDGMTLAA